MSVYSDFVKHIIDNLHIEELSINEGLVVFRGTCKGYPVEFDDAGMLTIWMDGEPTGITIKGTCFTQARLELTKLIEKILQKRLNLLKDIPQGWDKV